MTAYDPSQHKADHRTRTRPHFVNIAEYGFLNTLMFDNLTKDASVATTNDEDFLRVRVRVHGKVSNHLLVPGG